MHIPRKLTLHFKDNLITCLKLFFGCSGILSFPILLIKSEQLFQEKKTLVILGDVHNVETWARNFNSIFLSVCALEGETVSA